MGVYSHDPDAPPMDGQVFRPPGLEARSCSTQKWIPNHVDGPRYAPCYGSAVWAVTEVSFCAHHLPVQYFEVAARRKALWADMGAELWRDICAEIPIVDEP
jgi:hypothetical protein